jgi:transcriptional regulator of acetoin/glycerol metabolism
VGENREIGIKARLIFASGNPLEKLVEQGRFRRDFYFRLKSGHTVSLPALRNSVNRIREACRFFSLQQNVTLSQRLTDFYETLAWPGNLRQLFGHLEKKKILTNSTRLDFDYLDDELLLQSSDLLALKEFELKPLKSVKEEYVKKAISLCDGNVSLAARKLQLTEKTIRTIVARISLPEHK